MQLPDELFFKGEVWVVDSIFSYRSPSILLNKELLEKLPGKSSFRVYLYDSFCYAKELPALKRLLTDGDSSNLPWENLLNCSFLLSLDLNIVYSGVLNDSTYTITILAFPIRLNPLWTDRMRTTVNRLLSWVFCLVNRKILSENGMELGILLSEHTKILSWKVWRLLNYYWVLVFN